MESHRLDVAMQVAQLVAAFEGAQHLKKWIQIPQQILEQIPLCTLKEQIV
jgi:hypothetical protein